MQSGTIHHWRGAVFIPGATVEEVLEAVANPAGPRAHRQEDVLETRVLARSPNALRLFLKLQRRVIVSVAYNTEHDVVYRTHGSGRASSRSVATRIAEVVNLGEPDEHERPTGFGSRFSLGSELVLALRGCSGWRRGRARVVDAEPQRAVGSGRRGQAARGSGGARISHANARRPARAIRGSRVRRPDDVSQR